MEYGLIGKSLKHSISKEIHSKIGDYNYDLYEMSEEELIKTLKKPKFKAVNITIPYKQTVIPFLSELTQEAKSIGAVNCIKNVNGRLIGHNTDMEGLIGLMHKFRISPKDKKVLILGSGGTSKTAYKAVQTLGASEIHKVSRNPKGECISYNQAVSEHLDTQIIINTTPCGMYPNVQEKPIELKSFKKLYSVIDVIYNPQKTLLIKEALKLGVKSASGLYMLVCQAVRSAEFFMDTCLDLNLCDDIYEYFRQVDKL